MTNCILADVTNVSQGATYVTGNNGYYQTPVIGMYWMTNSFYPFQEVGAGQFYLTNGCNFIGAGTTNVDPVLLADLRQKTVYPPVLYSNLTFSTNLVLGPQAQRDTNANVSFGYHYDSVDYVFGGCRANGNVTFAAGTVMGWFELPNSYGAGYGLALQTNLVCSFNGTATSRCAEVRYDTVQEGGDGLWKDKGWLAGIITAGSDNGVASAPRVQATFTDFDVMTADPNNVRDYYAPLIFQPEHSEFGSGAFGGYQISLDVTNCLFDRSYLAQVQGESGNVVNVVNCTFHGGLVQMVPSNPMTVTFLNCSFDGTTNDFEGYADNAGYDTFDYNAYTPSSDALPVGGANNVTVTNGFNWQTSWFGDYYLPTNSPVIGKGSTTAGQLGLYHFTTQTNQTVDGNAEVTIGYHYVATDQYGNPLDSNQDGIPDYLEDANGNGLYDAGEPADWQARIDSTVPAAWYTANGLDSGNPLIGILDADWDGLLNQQEYLYGSDPQVSEGFNIWVSTPNGATSIP